MKIGLIGAGHMGGAILRGLASCPSKPELRVFDSDETRAKSVAAAAGAVVASSVADCADGCDLVVFAVRPGDLGAALEALGAPPLPVILSIAAGRTTHWIESHLPVAVRVIRAMPNLGASQGLAATAFCLGSSANRSDAALASHVLSCFGTAVELPEKNIDAVTALSGSGPAFLAYALEAMADAGRSLGLPADVSGKLAVQTFLGTATVLSQPGAPEPAAFVKSVATPGGTTAAGMDILAASDVRQVFSATLGAACRRAAELSAG